MKEYCTTHYSVLHWCIFLVIVLSLCWCLHLLYDWLTVVFNKAFWTCIQGTAHYNPIIIIVGGIITTLWLTIDITRLRLCYEVKNASLQFLVETMLDAQSVSGQGNAEKVLNTVSNTFGFSDIKAFIEVFLEKTKYC